MELNHISVAIIDDGINEKLYNVGELKHNIEITDDLKISLRKNYNRYEDSHGTTCAAIIKKYAKEVQLSSVKILSNSTLKGRKENLIASIEWCIENKVKLINLSLGTIDYRDFEEIKSCINLAEKNGIIIIAACNNNNIFTYPASHSNVIGVKTDFNYFGSEYAVIEHSNKGIDLIASSRHIITNIFKRKSCTKLSNSFAAPLITALVSRILQEDMHLSLEEIKLKLKEQCQNTVATDYNPYFKLSVDWLESFFVIDFLQEKSLNSNNYASNYKNIKQLTEFQEFIDTKSLPLKFYNTVILNLTDSLIVQIDQISKLLSYFNDNKINLILFYNSISSENISNILKSYKIKIWDIHTYNYFIKNCTIKKIDLEIPIIYIRSSKYEVLLQLVIELNRVFRRNGYNSIALTNIKLSILEGLELIADEKLITNYTQFFFQRYNCDIEIIGIYDEKSINKTYLNFDINIEVSSNLITLTGEGNIKSIIAYEDNVEYEEVDKLYNAIINILS